MPRLVIVSSTQRREVPLVGGCVVGRIDECDLVLEDDKSSRKHCEFFRDGDTYKVKDLGSSNGTLVNDRRIEEHVLEDGDQVRIGSTTLTFLVTDADHAIDFQAGERAGERVPLVGERLTLGRKPENTRTFDDIKVSGVHLEIVREGDQWVLRDLGSTNGTVLDGRKVDEVVLTHGDKVRLGVQEFLFLDLQAAAPSDESDAPAAMALSTTGVKRGGLGGVLSLVVLLAVLGGAAWFFFFGKGGGGESGPAVATTPVPAGSLLAQDWSFENADAVGGLWSNSTGSGFRVRRGGARSGGASYSATPEGMEVASAERSALPVLGITDLTWQVSLDVAEGALGSLVLQFLPENEDDPSLGLLPVVVAQSTSTGDEYRDLSGTVAVPSWAGSVQAVLVARGGDVRVDDLSLVRGTSGASEQVGTLHFADRGQLVGVAQLQPQFEFFSAFATSEVEGRAQELPAGAVDLAVQREASRVEARWSPGPFAPEALRILIHPDTAAMGLTVMRAETSERQGGAFQADDVVALVLGGSAERTEIRFERPCRLSSMAYGDGLQIRITPEGSSLAATLRSDFEAERQEASSLFVQAQTAAREGRVGEAVLKYRDVHNRLPYHDQTMAQVRERVSELVVRVTEETQEIEEQAKAAEFLDNLIRYRAVLERMDALMASLAGLEPVESLVERAAAIRARVEELGSLEREAEAARLQRLAEALEQLEFMDRSASVKELRRALKESY